MNPQMHDTGSERKENIEAARERSPQEQASEMLRAGGQEITSIKNLLDNIRLYSNRVGANSESATEIKGMEAEVDAAWSELETEVKQITKNSEVPNEKDLDWEIPEETTSKDEALEAPTSEDAEWDIPEEPEIPRTKVEKYTLNLEEQAQASELITTELTEAFAGKTPTAKYDALMGTTEGRANAEFEFQNHMSRVLDQPEIKFESLEATLSIANRHEATKEKVTGLLVDRVGKKYADKIVNSPEYRTALKELQRSLDGKLGDEKGPPICSERNLENLIAINEILGASARNMVDALDLTNYSKNVKHGEGNQLDVVRVNSRRFNSETGDFEGEIQLTSDFDPNTTITRSFSRRLQRDENNGIKNDENGEPQKVTSVHHDLFQLSEDVQDEGIAAKVTAKSLEIYDKSNIDDITLFASKEAGGYAWASYGYGWDLNHPGEQIKMITQVRNKFFDAISDAELLEDGKSNDPKIQTTLDRLEEFRKNPEAVTPQMLAALGKDGPTFKQAASGKWYTEEGFNRALGDGSEQGEIEGKKGSMHAGKIGLLGTSWHGKIELKPNGEQGGKNRALLEKKINRSTNK